MNRRRFTLILAINILVILAISISTAFADSGYNFRASLKNRNEPVIISPADTNAQGEAIVKISEDETSIDFKLIVANIEDVTQAHIHCGAAGVNGPVVAFLFGFDPAGVDVNGVLAQGTIESDDVIPRAPSAACPDGVADMAELIERIRSGDAYVNVHTIVNPGGAIRGQLH